ncbi:hypothetical protein [Dinghuibacter silviterrae]|uniref:Uncharacterized protein n=1 Tax=Dinghuibacter silviterrae TaxID=1539049 RepID=A0A4R8DNX9_9BACT|nr:hypothetical protein [Dinghuibacter silviterrae]TDW99753.1 hypothetical protein EDB95_0764 [Dinghuibacter silviterrae]
MMTLTTAQIDRLFDLCREKGIDYYDIQVELVDHLAAAIEARPAVPFETALSEATKGFGYRGFGTMVKTRRKQLTAQYRRMFWSMFVAYFNWPKVMLTLLLLTVFYVLPFYLPLIVLKHVNAAAAIYLIAFELFIWWKQKRQCPAPRRPLLMLKLYPVSFTSAIMLNLYLNVFKGFRWLDGDGSFTLLTYRFFCIAYVLMLAIMLAFYDTKAKLSSLAIEKYPGAFTV